ncbi:MAG: hypothetical protein IPO21_10820 [Bacteroidales bacterium]|nr:hypothetical protein [Bacteroidales bacterium]
MNFNIVVINDSEVTSLLRELYDFIFLEYTVDSYSDINEFNNSQASVIDIIILNSNDPIQILDIIRQVRSKKKFKYVPFLLLTDIHIYLNTQNIDKLGSVDFLSKPVDKFSLACRVLHNMNLSRATRTMMGENIVLKSKLLELEKLRIKNLSLYSNKINLEKINNQLLLQKDEISKQQYILIEEKLKSEELLQNILPEETSRELMIHGKARTQAYHKVSILFCDFVGFTNACESLKPQEIVDELHRYFSKFDEICEMHFIEKIKTIGDAYMCAGGLPMRNNSNPIDITLAALAMIEYVEKENKRKILGNLPVWRVRIGIHTGPIVAGVIGKKKFAYDIWGDAVNTAARMESSSEAGMINVSEYTHSFIKEFFDCTSRGKILAKHKGMIDMYYVNGLKDKFAYDGNTKIPNKQFIMEHSKL